MKNKIKIWKSAVAFAMSTVMVISAASTTLETLAASWKTIRPKPVQAYDPRKDVWVFNVSDGNYAYCAREGLKFKNSNNGGLIKEKELGESDPIYRVMLWGFRKTKNNKDKFTEEGDRAINERLWKIYTKEAGLGNITLDEKTFRIATRLAVWKAANGGKYKKSATEKTATATERAIADRIYAWAMGDVKGTTAVKINAKLFAKKGPGIVAAVSDTKIKQDGAVFRVNPQYFVANLPGFEYSVGISQKPMKNGGEFLEYDKGDKPATERYTKEYPSGFTVQFRSVNGVVGDTYKFMSYEDGDALPKPMQHSEVDAHNKKTLDAMIKSNHGIAYKDRGDAKIKSGSKVYISFTDTDSAKVKDFMEHVSMFAKPGVPQETKVSLYAAKNYWDSSKNMPKSDYQTLVASETVYGNRTAGIKITPIDTKMYNLEVIKYPSDGEFQPGFSINSLDYNVWDAENKGELIKGKSRSASVNTIEVKLLAYAQSLATEDASKDSNKKVFEEYKQSDEQTKLTMLKTYPWLSSGDTLSTAFSNHYKTLAEQDYAAYSMGGQVSSTFKDFFATIESVSTLANDSGEYVNSKINASFRIKGKMGWFDNATVTEGKVTSIKKYTAATTYYPEGEEWVYIQTEEGRISIQNVLPSEYRVTEYKVEHPYTYSGFANACISLKPMVGKGKEVLYTTNSKMATNKDTNVIKQYPDKVGSVNSTTYWMNIPEKNTNGDYTYAMSIVDYAGANFSIRKHSQADKNGEKASCAAPFRLVGIDNTCDYYVENEDNRNKYFQEPKKNYDIGYNFYVDGFYEYPDSLAPGRYELYEYRSGMYYQEYDDSGDGDIYTMDDGFEEVDKTGTTPKDRLVKVGEFTVKENGVQTAETFEFDVENRQLPRLAIFKMDQSEYDAKYKDWETNTAKRDELVNTLNDQGDLNLTVDIDATFNVKGVTQGASFPDGKEFTTSGHVVVIPLEPGTYEVRETAVIAGGDYVINDKVYTVNITENDLITTPIIIVHPNAVSKRQMVDLDLNKTNPNGNFMDGAKFSLASYLSYDPAFSFNKLTQKSPTFEYTGMEFYAEGIIRNGGTSFINIPTEVDSEGRGKVWVHIHELLDQYGGFDTKPYFLDERGVRTYWSDYAEDCPICRERGREHANGYDVQVNVKTSPELHGKLVLQVHNDDEKSKEGTLLIHKESIASARPLAGAEFEVFANGKEVPINLENGKLVTGQLANIGTKGNAVLTTGDDGTIRIKVTEEWINDPSIRGKFTIKEVKAPTGYLITSQTETELTTEVTAGGIGSVIVKNAPDLVDGKVTVLKTDEGGKVLPGALFYLYEAEKATVTVDTDIVAGEYKALLDRVVGTATSDKDGLLTFSALEIDKPYILAEKRAPSGYSLAKPVLVYAVPETSSKKVVVVNEKEPFRIKVVKSNEEHERLSNAEFTVLDTRGSVVDYLITDINGEATSKALPVGKYTLKEVKAPKGYVVSTDVIEVNGVDSTTVEVSVVNKKVKGKVKVSKISSVSNSTERYPLTGAEFVVKRMGSDEILDTLIVGTKDVSVELPYGEYTLTETKAPNGYYLDNNDDGIPDSVGKTYPFIITENDSVVEVTVENKPIQGRLSIHKINNLYTKDPIMNVKFEVYNAKDDTYVGSLLTNSSGDAKLDGLLKGDYYFIETETPANYWGDTSKHYFTIDESTLTVSKGIHFETVVNERVELKIRIHKTDEDGKNLEGIGFSLIRKETNTAMEFDGKAEFFTNALGQLVFPGTVQYGNYLIRETTTPNKLRPADDIEIKIDSTTKFVDVEIGKTVDVSVINFFKRVSITIRKLAEGISVPLKGAEFRLVSEENGYDKTFVTDGNGNINVTGLKVGRYTWIETKAPNGYINTDNSGTAFSGIIDATEDLKNYQITVYNKEAPKGYLEIIKIDSITGDVLSGAAFKIVKSDGTEDVVTTGNDGKVSVTGLPLGKTRIEELVAPKGYKLGKDCFAEFDITLEKTSFSYTFKNEKEPVEEKPKGSLEITKRDLTTDELIPNCVFEVHKNGTLVTRGVTDSNGICKFSLDDGEYTYTEVSAPSKYKINTEPQRFTITYGRVTHSEFKNSINEGEVRILKVDAVSKKPLSNATFTITDMYGKHYKTVTTDSNGVAIVKLNAGEYVCQEILAPNGYLLDTKQQRFSITKDGDIISLVFENTKQPEVPSVFSITKVDITTSKPLPNALITIRDLNGNIIEQKFTDSSGDASFILKPGTYTYEESAAPNGYVLETGRHEFQIKSSGEIVKAILTNEPIKSSYGHIEITKTDVTTSEPLPNTLITIINATTGVKVVEKRTDSNGKVSFTLAPGSYYFKESEAPKGYVIDETPHPFEIKGNGEIVKAVMTNIKNNPQSGTFILTKTDLTTSEPLPSALITIINAITDEKVAEKRTGIDGKAYFNLTVGKYYFKESEAPKGYIIDETPQPFEIKENGDIVRAEMTNRKKSTNGIINITKTDVVTSKPLPNTLITIRDESGKKIVEKRTDGDGNASFTLGVGRYTYQESEAPKGYVLDETPHPFEIKGNGEIIKAHMTNVKKESGKGIVIITKQDINDDQTKLPNTLITIRDENGNKVVEKRTDSNGEAAFSLNVGKYTYQETDAPEGYLLNEEEYPFEIKKNGEIVRCIMTDERVNNVGSLFINKVDGNTGEPLAGATFVVTDMNDSEVDVGITDKAGRLRFSLPYGKYIVKETKAPIGYKKNKVSKVISINSKTPIVTKTFENFVHSKVIITKIDASNGETLKGAKFSLMKNGSEVANGVTDSEGKLVLELSRGEYVLNEVEAPSGYIVSDKPIKFMVQKDGQAIKLLVKNKKMLHISALAKTGKLRTNKNILYTMSLCATVTVSIVIYTIFRRYRGFYKN